MDWDKLRAFSAAAATGSFTQAGEALGLSQSAVSRHVSSLEQDLKVSLFHRHARGLVLTEQGELLLETAREVMAKLDAAEMALSESREKPTGELKITTSFGIGMGWLTPRLGPFLELYPDIKVEVILADEELDLGMREADVALRLREPSQPGLIRRRLFAVHYHLYASANYLRRHGEPHSLADLVHHRLLAYSATPGSFLNELNAPLFAGHGGEERVPAMLVNNIPALQRGVESGIGIGVLPDYLNKPGTGLVQLMTHAVTPTLDCYLVYPETMKNVARVKVFRDFLVASAQRWQY
ncbi:MAG: LysR family transcriptional regulator [Beijerinckiaceae bacterium]|nr:LysR family transcriptional regulator [Beijerinckiaceae bacterium]